MIDKISTILTRFKKNETFTCLFLTACFTGLRTGEVCGLTWDDIDLEKRLIYISSSEKTRKEANDMLEEIIKSDVINEIMNY